MSKVKYLAKENTKIGTHSFYAVPVPNGTLTFEELLEEACDDNTFNKSEMRGCVEQFMKVVQRNVLKGFRVPVGDDFLTIYPNLSLSVKDRVENGITIVATAEMLNASNGKSRLGATVSAKFSREFADNVSWQKIIAATEPADEDEDITDGGGQSEGTGDVTPQGTGDNTGGEGTGGTDLPANGEN